LGTTDIKRGLINKGIYHRVYMRQIASLNNLLKVELGLVELYEQTVKEFDRIRFITIMQASQHAHRTQAARLAKKINELGGEPIQSSGLKGLLSKMIGTTAAAVGDKYSFEVLDESEKNLSKAYAAAIAAETEEGLKQFITENLLPSQNQTLTIITNLKTILRRQMTPLSSTLMEKKFESLIEERRKIIA
jgi:hypothetical protein